MKKFRLFALKSVPNELENPAKDKQAQCIHPEWMNKNSCNAKRAGEHDHGDAKSMAKPVDRMRMAASVLCNPLLAGASAKHALDYN